MKLQNKYFNDERVHNQNNAGDLRKVVSKSNWEVEVAVITSKTNTIGLEKRKFSI